MLGQSGVKIYGRLPFSNVSRAACECLKKAAKDQGYPVVEDRGSYSKDGYTVRWDYDANARRLVLQCTDAPWNVPCFVINAAIHLSLSLTGCLRGKATTGDTSR